MPLRPPAAQSKAPKTLSDQICPVTSSTYNLGPKKPTKIPRKTPENNQTQQNKAHYQSALFFRRRRRKSHGLSSTRRQLSKNEAYGKLLLSYSDRDIFSSTGSLVVFVFFFICFLYFFLILCYTFVFAGCDSGGVDGNDVTVVF